jgi:hypothetical protein
MRVSSRALGWYHIVGAVAGGALTGWAYMHGAVLPTNSLATSAIPFALSWSARIGLLYGRRRARKLAYLTQLLQIPIVILPAISWKFVAGAIASVTLTLKGIGLFTGLEASWLVGTGRAEGFPIALGFNLAPIAIIVLLRRSSRAVAEHPRACIATEQPKR